MNPAINELWYQVNSLINEFGEQVRLKYYIFSYSGTDYDNGYYSQSGNSLWISGFKQNIGTPSDYEYLQQGRIKQDDSKLYIIGSINLLPGSGTYKFGFGSPTFTEYTVLPEGVQAYTLGGSTIYTRSFIRILQGGSFTPEI